MDITHFIATNRDRAFLIGDHNIYRSQLSRRLLALRRRLGRTTPRNAKFAKKAPVTIADVASNHEFVHLLVLQAERAWAHAMHMKNTLSETGSRKTVNGNARRHIISRLNKAVIYAEHLASLLQDLSGSKATETDYLEAVAYVACLTGAKEFEKQEKQQKAKPAAAWSGCIAQYSLAHIIYTALFRQSKSEDIKEALAGNVDPVLRVAAHRFGLSRTTPVSTIAKQYCSKDRKLALSLTQSIHPDALKKDENPASHDKSDSVAGRQGTVIPTSLMWRNREAHITDAAIGQALAATSTAIAALNEKFLETLNDIKSNVAKTSTKDLATAYDPTLTAAQDTINAVKRAISEAQREGFAESDDTMQNLRIGDLRAHYDLISWRIGRNRVVISSSPRGDMISKGIIFDDGATFESLSEGVRRPRAGRTRRSIKNKADADNDTITSRGDQDIPVKQESQTHALNRLSTRLVLYDSVLQSLDSLTELPGARRDTAFMAEIAGKRAYFRSLRSLNIAFAHNMLGNWKEALALSDHAGKILEEASPGTEKGTSTDEPPTLTISVSQLDRLKNTVQATTSRLHGVVAMLAALEEEQRAKAQKDEGIRMPPLAYRLESSFTTSPDLLKPDYVVTYPPKLEVVPVKPVLFDLAWNYIDYPGRELVPEETTHQSTTRSSAPGTIGDGRPGTPKKEEQKKGGISSWFGFGGR